MKARLIIATLVAGGAVLAVGGSSALAGKPSGSGALYPDFASAVPHHFTVQNTGQEEFLRFSNGIANIGAGPFQIRPENDPVTLKTTGFQEVLNAAGAIVVNQPVSEFVFHPEHNHWHITAVALYEVRTALDNGTGGNMGGVVGGQSLKTTFCLIDWIKLEGNSNNNGRTYLECRPDARQGLSVGWVDQYHMALEGQEVKITGVAPGTYYLRTTANPDGNFLETTTANNSAWTSFTLSRDSSGNAKITEISHSACSGGLCGEQIPNR
jgi:hypothetical protein